MSVPGRWHTQNLVNKLKICSVPCMYALAQFYFILFIYSFLVVPVFIDVCRLSLVAASKGYSLVVEHRL